MPLYENLLYSMALLAMVVDLKTETIPNEGILEIGDGAFCSSNLSTIDIPSSVERIISNSFYYGNYES